MSDEETIVDGGRFVCTRFGFQTDGTTDVFENVVVVRNPNWDQNNLRLLVELGGLVAPRVLRVYQYAQTSETVVVQRRVVPFAEARKTTDASTLIRLAAQAVLTLHNVHGLVHNGIDTSTLALATDVPPKAVFVDFKDAAECKDNGDQRSTAIDVAALVRMAKQLLYIQNRRFGVGGGGDHAVWTLTDDDVHKRTRQTLDLLS